MKENNWGLVAVGVVMVVVETIVIIVAGQSLIAQMKEFFASLWPFGYKM